MAAAGDLGHIHDLVLTGESDLLVASHTGLYRVEALDRAVLAGPEQHDLMSMTALEDGVLVASGHPDLRLDEYRVPDTKALLGLVESADDGSARPPRRQDHGRSWLSVPTSQRR